MPEFLKMGNMNMDFEAVKEKIDQVDIVSFDIFDTLIKRICERPEEVFEIVERETGIQDFCRLRIEAQQEASRKVLRSGKASHANLDQIYDQLQDNMPQVKIWNQIKEFEMQIEYMAVFCNDDVYQLYLAAKRMGKRVIAVSDMYLSEEMLQKLLAKCGYIDIDAVYVSSDCRATKYEGKLFAYVQEKESIDGTRILHIGDNYQSDYVSAKKNGLKSWYYDFRESIPFFQSLGFVVAGKLYVNLYHWIEEKKKEYQSDHIFFLARDGYNMNKLWEQNGRRDGKYLLTSRRALLLAGIEKLDEENLQLLPPYAFGQTIDEIVDYLCVDSEKLILEGTGFTALTDVIKDANDKSKFRVLLKTNETLFLERCAVERKNAEKYFESINFFGGSNLIFDCGWNGSSQYLLKRFLNTIPEKAEYRFLYVGILENEKSKRQLAGEKYDTYLFGKGRGKKIEAEFRKAIIIPELFFGAPHSSVWTYGEKVLLENGEASEIKQDILNGILEYSEKSKDMYSLCKKKEQRESLIRPLCRIINKPSAEEAYHIGNVENADGFVQQKGQKKYIARLTVKTILNNPRIEIYWVKGLLKRKDMSFWIKSYVICKSWLKQILSKKE